MRWINPAEVRTALLGYLGDRMTGSETGPPTLGELRASGWRPRTVKEELRANLLARLA